MEVDSPKRKPITASRRIVVPVSAPIHLIFESAERNLFTRSAVKMSEMGGKVGSTYPGSLDREIEKNAIQKPAQQKNNQVDCAGLRVCQRRFAPAETDQRRMAVHGMKETSRTGM
jgi:hypothetical protein